MRGGFLHNEVILASVAQEFEQAEWQVELEVPIRMGESIGFVDLVADRDGWCVAVEAECSPRRVGRDLDKAQALRAHELWIVTPNAGVAAAVRRSLDRMHVQPNRGGLFVLTQGQAVQRVTRCLRLFAAA